MYFDPVKNTFKGDIPVSSEMHVVVNGKKFNIVTPKRTYYFKELVEDPQRWVTAVEKLKQNITS